MAIITTAILIGIAISNGVSPIYYEYIWVVALLGLLVGIFEKTNGDIIGASLKIGAIGALPFALKAIASGASSLEVVIFTSIIIIWYSWLSSDSIKIGHWAAKVFG